MFPMKMQNGWDGISKSMQNVLCGLLEFGWTTAAA